MTHVQPGRTRLLTPTRIAVALAAALAFAFIAVAVPNDAHAKKADKTAKQLKKLNKQVKKANKLAQQANAQAAEAIDLANQALEQGGKAGPAGPAGPAGVAGADGEDGAPGADGSDGESVGVTAEPPGGNCPDAGYKLSSASGTDYVCNGSNGTDGSPWTAGGTLPGGATQTGYVAISGSSANGSIFVVPISFTIPLAQGLDEEHAVMIPSSGSNPDAEHCSGSASNPTAASGYLCIYSTGTPSNLSFLGIYDTSLINPGTSTAGATAAFMWNDDSPSTYYGVWAVTG